MKACIILHNMIVDDERDTYARNFMQLSSYDDVANDISQPELLDDTIAPYWRYIQNNIQLRDRRKHQELQADLVEHIWQFHNAR